MSQEKLINDYQDGAEKRIRGDFILKKIAEVEEIKISDDDLRQAFERISQQYGMPVDEVKKFFQSRNDLLPFMNELLSEKIVEFLRENAVVKEVAADSNKEEASKSGDTE